MLTDKGKERACGDILYFVDAGSGSEGKDIVVHEEEDIAGFYNDFI